ncbi:MAG: glycoside hydrolase family 15 [Actinomadura rubrobrunea]|nr:glycoside hydrolase family 15 [Actinomadura rubrobrunea]
MAMLLVAGLAATCGARMPSASGPGWRSPGLVGGGGWPFAGVPLDADDGHGAAYLPGSSAVLLRDGRVRLVPLGAETAVTVPASDPLVAQAVRSDRRWLARGTVPGRTPLDRELAERALLDLRLLTRPNGASLASWYGPWRYAWPRDAAFAAAAFAVTGHTAEARQVLRFLESVQTDDGRWAARYHPDGRAVTDGRAPQLDSLGWVVWASWLVHTQDPAGTGRLPELWRMVARAADRMARSLDSEGLPPPSSDYFERSPSTEQDPDSPTLGVVGPMLAGLRAAAALARERGDEQRELRWQEAARRLSDAVARRFAPYGYPRSPMRGGRMDTSVTFVAPPFAPPDPGAAGGVLNAAARLRLPNGGVLPGEKWAGDRTVAWTPETAMFALAAAAAGRTDEARARLDWLARHRTSLGALPEKVDAKGRQAGVAPLGWTAALVLLTLTALDRPLPVPPP